MTPAMSMCAQLSTSTNSCMEVEVREREGREGREGRGGKGGEGGEEKRGSEENPAQK